MRTLWELMPEGEGDGEEFVNDPMDGGGELGNNPNDPGSD